MAKHVDPAVQMLLDKDEIKDLVSRFSLYADLNEPEALVDLMTEDGIIDTGPGRRSEGREALLRYEQKTLSGIKTSQPADAFTSSSHHNANVLIEFTGPDEADVKTWCLAWHRIADQTPQAWGIYYDKVVRTSAGWKFKERFLRLASDDEFPGGRRWHRLERRPAGPALVESGQPVG